MDVTKMIERIHPRMWGVDHTSTLLYAEHRAVESGGYLVRQQMRCSLVRKGLAHGSSEPRPSRLCYGAAPEGHDDWSCLLDMQEAGLLTVNLEDRKVAFTDLGWAVAAYVRRSKAEGVNRDDLDYSSIIPECQQRIERFEAIQHIDNVAYEIGVMYQSAYRNHSDKDSAEGVDYWQGQKNAYRSALALLARTKADRERWEGLNESASGGYFSRLDAAEAKAEDAYRILNLVLSDDEVRYILQDASCYVEWHERTRPPAPAYDKAGNLLVDPAGANGEAIPSSP